MNTTGPQFVLTYDVGGSHVSAGLCRLTNLQIVRVASGSLAGLETFESFVDLLFSLGTQAAAGETDIAGASLAVPGPFDCEAGVSLMEHKLTPLYGKNLRAALAQKFGWSSNRLRFLNDACAFLLGEVGAGSVKGVARAVGITLGTGIGCAFAIDGVCVREGKGVPPGGEIWDYPYADGTVEDLISTRALKAEYLARTGQDVEVVQIADMAGADPDAREVLAIFGRHLGDVLRDVIAPFHPDSVVIGGGISRSSRLFLPAAQERIAGLGFTVVQSALLDQAPLVGAGHYWREQAAGVTAAPAPVASAQI